MSLSEGMFLLIHHLHCSLPRHTLPAPADCPRPRVQQPSAWQCNCLCTLRWETALTAKATQTTMPSVKQDCSQSRLVRLSSLHWAETANANTKAIGLEMQTSSITSPLLPMLDSVTHKSSVSPWLSSASIWFNSRNPERVSSPSRNSMLSTNRNIEHGFQFALLVFPLNRVLEVCWIFRPFVQIGVKPNTNTTACFQDTKETVLTEEMSAMCTRKDLLETREHTCANELSLE